MSPLDPSTWIPSLPASSGAIAPRAPRSIARPSIPDPPAPPREPEPEPDPARPPALSSVLVHWTESEREPREGAIYPPDRFRRLLALIQEDERERGRAGCYCKVKATLQFVNGREYGWLRFDVDASPESIDVDERIREAWRSFGFDAPEPEPDSARLSIAPEPIADPPIRLRFETIHGIGVGAPAPIAEPEPEPEPAPEPAPMANILRRFSVTFPRSARILDAAAREAGRYAMHSVLLDLDLSGAGSARLVATDGRALAVLPVDIESDPGTLDPLLGAASILLPPEIVKAATVQTRSKGRPARLEIDATDLESIRITTNHPDLGRVEVRSMVGEFPRWRAILDPMSLPDALARGGRSFAINPEYLANVARALGSPNCIALRLPEPDEKGAISGPIALRCGTSGTGAIMPIVLS